MTDKNTLICTMYMYPELHVQSIPADVHVVLTMTPSQYNASTRLYACIRHMIVKYVWVVDQV